MPVICSALNKELPFSIHTGEWEWENSVGKKENVTFTQNTKDTKLSEKHMWEEKKKEKTVGVGARPEEQRNEIEFLILREGIKFPTRKINQGNFYRMTNTLITYRKSWALRWSQFKDKRASSHSSNTAKGSSMNSRSRDTESGIPRDVQLHPASCVHLWKAYYWLMSLSESPICFSICKQTYNYAWANFWFQVFIFYAA